MFLTCLGEIECSLLSGLYVRHFLRPLAGMEISRPGPNLPCELLRSKGATGFPAPDLFDHLPIQVIDFLHLPFTGLRFRRVI